MTTLRTSRAGATLALAALLAGFPFALAGLAPADAKPIKAHRAQSAAAGKQAKAATAAKPMANPADADDANPEAIAQKRTPHYTSESGVDEGVPTEEGCVRPRKRLWVEGEGWIVRRVTVCR